MKSLIQLSLVVGILTSLSIQSQENNLELSAIADYKKDSLNYDFISTLSVIDTTVSQSNIDSFKSKLNFFIQTLPTKEAKSKREIKRIKKIYTETHNKFLKKYEEVAYFPEIFKTGNYNCVSATALYAYIFEKIKVPYAIKDAPSHVYLIAYPKTHKIILETTVPGAYGFLTPKDSEVEDQVKQLVELKLVTQNEVNNKGKSKVFMDYFYGKDELDKVSLIGMQYYNSGILNLEKMDYKSAIEDINKSLTFYPYTPSEFLYRGLIGLQLEEIEFNKLENIEYLKNMFNNLSYDLDYSKKDVIYYTYKIIDHDENDLEFLDSVATFSNTIRNSEVRSIMKEAIYEYIAKTNAQNGNTANAMIAADSILALNPKSKIAKEIIVFSVGKKIAASTLSEDEVNYNQDLYEKYSFLKGNLRIESLMAITYGRLAQDHFRMKDPKQAEIYLNKFEKIMDSYGSDLDINPEAHSQLYLQAGRYYYGKTKNHQALVFFKKGLEYNPNHLDLKKMLKWVKEDMK